MNWMFENWFVVVGLLSVVIVAVLAVIKFLGLPTSKQLTNIKEWLLWAVSVSEKELGSGTGPLKLRYVYNMFIDKFPMTAKFISFETFSKLVVKALERFEELLKTNKAINNIVVVKEVVKNE